MIFDVVQVTKYDENEYFQTQTWLKNQSNWKIKTFYQVFMVPNSRLFLWIGLEKYDKPYLLKTKIAIIKLATKQTF